MNRQTTIVRKEDAQPRWWIIDGTDQVLGRLSVSLARMLMGKHTVRYTPHTDTGDCIVVVNADRIRVTGNKGQTKEFQTFSGYPNGQKRFSYEWMLQHKPELLLERSVRRMMPRGPLRHQRMGKLKIYRGSDHPHQAQNPKPLKLGPGR
jgi:large subunit ribosomal protein L13